MKVLGLVVARGGSKGLTNKNLRLINGRPLISYAAEALIKCKKVDTSICSTDSLPIANAAKKAGLSVPFLRPPELSQDGSLVIDAVKHAIESQNSEYTHVIMLQASSPTVTWHDLDLALQTIQDTNADTCISAYKLTETHPDYLFSINNSDSINWLIKKGGSTNRQDFDQFYARTGIFYLASVKTIYKENSFYGKKISTVIVPKERAIIIDNYEDLLKARRYLKK
jgi:CMP-N,N'-diacetyllegionaminic acid synthase